MLGTRQNSPAREMIREATVKRGTKSLFIGVRHAKWWVFGVEDIGKYITFDG